MENNQLIIPYIQYNSIDELSIDDKNLYQKALEATEKAYAPYSHFYVGVALLLGNGEIITANNQENVAYPSGMCAERVALYSAFAQFPNAEVATIFIVAKYNNKLVSVSPCGACRQVMAEYEKRSCRKMRIFFISKNNTIILVQGVSNIIPFSFLELN